MASQSVPSHSIWYLVRLKDGRIIDVLATGTEAATGFAGMIEAAMSSLQEY